MDTILKMVLWMIIDQQNQPVNQNEVETWRQQVLRYFH